MNEPIDLTMFREITDGNADVERMLFETFFTSSDECMAALKKVCTNEGANEWRAHAHALKGISVNLGAMRLGELCKQAQEGFQESFERKSEMLAALECELERVRAYLERVPAP